MALQPAATMLQRVLLAVPPAIATCGLVSAESISVQLIGSHVDAIVSAGVTVPHADLRSGTSVGAVLDHPWSTTIRSADGRNLESYFIRNGISDAWDVRLGTFQPSPGAAADFFVFEVGGNDTITARAQLPGGLLGTPITLSGWSPTGVTVSAGPNLGQQVHGLAFRFEDLRNQNGQPLTASDHILGVRLESSGVDGAAFLVREDGVHAPVDGDGSVVITPSNPAALTPLELSFRGEWFAETAVTPNPFVDRRMSVLFDGPGGRRLLVPGFFDADGADGDSGNRWAVRFLPPVPGSWTATVFMRQGTQVATTTAPGAGSPEPILDGRTLNFQVAPMRPLEEGFYRVGTLKDAGKHHRKFEFGPYFLKAGTNSPENFLAIRCLDDVTKSGGEGLIHSYEPHVQDWRQGDPLLSPGNVTDDGKGVIGALNYLSDAGVNSLFMMVMNLGGDGLDVYPFLGPKRRSFEKTHYDTSRLRQWNVIFEHAQRRAISLSLVMNETEIDNELWLDNGNLGVERRVFYREMIARFGHHPAIRWNICEENDFTLQQLDEFASWIKSLDADGHAVAIHNNPNDLALFQSLANNPNFDAASLQFDPNQADAQVEQVREWTKQTGRPWIVDADEQGPWQTGLTDSNGADTRKRVLYDALFSGGGVEFYFGYHSLPLGGDLNLEDFRTRSEMWEAVKHARQLIEGQLPFWNMEPHDDLVQNESGAYGGAECYAIPGEIYAIYYPNGSDPGSLQLQGFNQPFELEWYDPRNGVFAGAPVDLGPGGGVKWIPNPPNTTSEDWIAIVRPGRALEADRTTASISAQDLQQLTLRAGSSFAGRTYFQLSSFTGTNNGFVLGGITVPINFDRLTRYGIGDSQGLMFRNRTGTLDSTGSATMGIQLSPLVGGGLAGSTLYHVVVTLNPYDWISNVVTLQVIP